MKNYYGYYYKTLIIKKTYKINKKFKVEVKNFSFGKFNNK